MEVVNPRPSRKVGCVRHQIDVEHSQLLAGREANEAIASLASRQHGVVARRQLLGLGLGRGLIANRVEMGLLHPQYRGVYAVGHAALSRQGRWMAAVLSAGPNAYLSHGSAAALWGLRGERGPVEVIRSSDSRRAGGGILIRHTPRLTADDVTEEQRIPVVCVELALLQISAVLDDKQITRCLAAADRSRILRWDRLERVVEGTTAKGSGRLRKAMVLLQPSYADAASPGEVDFLAAAAQYGIPEPVVGAQLCGLVVDFYWPAQGVVAEYDGFGYHGDRASFEEDRHRDMILKEAGFEVIRVTHRMLQQRAAHFFRTLQSILERRAGWAS